MTSFTIKASGRADFDAQMARATVGQNCPDCASGELVGVERRPIVITLADFKRYLAGGGAVQLMTMVDIDRNGAAISMLPAEKLRGVRKAEKVQTNAVKFEGGSWLQFPKASQLRGYIDQGESMVEILDDLGCKLIYRLVG